MSTLKERFEAKFVKGDGCWEWTAYKNNRGYGSFRVSGGMQLAHRIAWTFYVGEIPGGLCVLHHCDNPGCIRPSHLFLGTIADNVHDCENKGRGIHLGLSGEKNGSAKLTEAQAIEIKGRRREGARGVDLAKEFRISQPAISMIVNGHTWAGI